ncbi:Ig-like domain-containing protein [Salinibacterium sp. G-O1]|uniref:Ig-like domain-containing protein n=1 Tax=Salinibacterium sp. G-O1 TaxID=3046208 RepID=UPI0024B89E01|nr:Ig-like domain-containing protein [Salinibacterium sp. G-O1]MDJ0335904.1 Ig-like domain-containing protein [Salinibacterium sp. G-O1]
MSALTRWVAARKSTASVLVVALVVGVPLTIAALHPGFPVSDVKLTSRDVWVTNGQKLLGGRLNRQIDELNGSVVASSANFDVMQDGDTLFMHDPDAGRVESVNPASTEVTSSVDVPIGAEVAYGGSVIAILAADGKLWGIPSVGDLQFNYVSDAPIAELGEGAHVAVSPDGVILAVSPETKTLFRIATLDAAPLATDFPGVGEFQLAAVGDAPVVFDQSTNEIVTEGGQRYGIGDAPGLALQQTGPTSGFAVLATADSLVRVDLGSGSVETMGAGFTSNNSDVSGIAAPVNQDGCAHGAWGADQTYLLSCEGQDVVTLAIAEPTQAGVLEFRVNRSVIALNDLTNGNVWLPSENMRLVNNWDDVTPPVEQESEEIGEEKSAIQSFEDTLAERTDTNRPPTAKDDEFGVRPGRTTILSVLDNDSDPDGDVLVISSYDAIAETTGRLDPIDGSRALQFTPVEGFVGSISFNYTVDDGRGGTDSAHVTARVVPDEINEAPYPVRLPGVAVEANQTISYNVLSDWRDPDGDDLYLIGASPKSGDLVRFTPDGFITFTHQTSELGQKEVQFQVSDGRGSPVTGTLTVVVEPSGTLNPIGTPDFASAFVGETTVIEPLRNDLSPSGAQLSLIGMDETSGGAVASFNSDRRQVTFSSSNPGIFYLKYTLQAGANTSVGIIRIDVKDKPADDNVPPIAVKDTAYLRGEEPITVSVLSNDVSPTGKILAVQSVTVPADVKAKGLVVELLESTLVRVTATSAMTEQVNFSYTISDGISTATAGVTVVPVPALTKHQPPVAADDAATVRVGDIITLDVLANDFHPDDSSMFLDTNLITAPTAGIAFVSNNLLRFQAPAVAGEYRVDYRVLDPFGEMAAATAVFIVTPLSTDGNRDPIPDPLVGRVLAGGSIRVDVPLNGIDPDGDSAQLLNFPQNPTLGSVVEVGNDYFIYDSSEAAAGTDEFSYRVYDTFGATGDASIRIAVIPQPSQLQPPNAVPDSVAVRPGRVAQVDLMANDSDPQGSPIKVSKTLVDVPKGIDAEVVGRQYLVVTAPETEQSFSLRYELTNDRGGKTMSYVLVTVTPDAPLLPPTANDVPILTKSIAGKKSFTVNIFDGYAFNPAGRTEDLVVSIDGPNAGAATLLERNGRIEVIPGETRQAIAYRVTNTVDELSAMAFILVPAAVDEDFDEPPMLDPNLPIQYVSMNESRQWALSDILVVPSGRDAHIYTPTSVSSIRSNGESSFVDDGTIRFTPAEDYRGPASITFTVSDGESRNDPKGIAATVTLPIVVGDPESRDIPPGFTTPNVQVEVGETSTTDLRQSTGHPNPQILQEVTYSSVSTSASTLTASLTGSQLALSIPRDAVKGSTYTVAVTLRWDKFTVPGTINVTVVGSTKPLPVAVADSYETKRPVGTFVMDPLTNDSNPYQNTGEPLTIVDAQISNAENVGVITFTGTQIRVTPNSTPHYMVIEVVYTVQDATKDRDRRVNGRITFTVTDVPDVVQKPDRDGDSAVGGDQSATIKFAAPATNGKTITGYQVKNLQTNTITEGCTAGQACTVNGLTNGTPYTFQVRAINDNGAGAYSAASEQITPYGTPGTVTPVSLAQSNRWAPGTIQGSWDSVGATGGTTTYFWNLNGGGFNQTSGLSTGPISGLSAGSYTIGVYAQNAGGKRSPAETQSNAVAINVQPTPNAVRNLSTPPNVSSNSTTLTWTWDAPDNASADQAGEGLQYLWSTSNGRSGTTTATSASITVGPGGPYSITVLARNSGGNGPSTTSGGTTVTAYTPPTTANEWHGHYSDLHRQQCRLVPVLHVFECEPQPRLWAVHLLLGHAERCRLVPDEHGRLQRILHQGSRHQQELRDSSRLRQRLDRPAGAGAMAPAQQVDLEGCLVRV